MTYEELRRRKVLVRAAMLLLLEGDPLTRRQCFAGESSASWTRRALESLDREGLIVKKTRQGRAGNEYEVLDEARLRELEADLSDAELQALMSETYVPLVEARQLEDAEEDVRRLEVPVDDESPKQGPEDDPAMELVVRVSEQLGAIATVLTSMDARIAALEVRAPEPPSDRAADVQREAIRDEIRALRVLTTDQAKRHEVFALEVRGGMSTVQCSADSAVEAFTSMSKHVSKLIGAMTALRDAHHGDLDNVVVALQLLFRRAGFAHKSDELLRPVEDLPAESLPSRGRLAGRTPNVGVLAAQANEAGAWLDEPGAPNRLRATGKP